MGVIGAFGGKGGVKAVLGLGGFIGCRDFTTGALSGKGFVSLSLNPGH